MFVGIVSLFDMLSKRIVSHFIVDDEKIALYSTEGLSEIEHAYAMTVHKSQGNEFNAVVMPVFSVISNLCYRNLLYTAVTRAKKIMILVGDEQVVRAMTENNSKIKRYSALKDFLCSESNPEDE